MQQKSGINKLQQSNPVYGQNTAFVADRLSPLPKINCFDRDSGSICETLTPLGVNVEQISSLKKATHKELGRLSYNPDASTLN